MQWDITVRQTCEYLLKYEYWCLYRNRSVSGKQEILDQTRLSENIQKH